MKVTTPAELDTIEASAARSAERSPRVLASTSEQDALKALWRMKVEAIGCDPMNTDRPLNLIEQLNQTFTYVASARAARILFEKHPGAAPFTLNLGTAAGSDIESENEGGVAAEVFAAVNTSNNEKLKKVIAKVGATTARFKYVFYMCPGVDKGLARRGTCVVGRSRPMSSNYAFRSDGPRFARPAGVNAGAGRRKGNA